MDQESTHRIVELGAFDAVGYRTECPRGDTSSIGPLWDRYFEDWQELPGNSGIIGVSWCDLRDDGFSYIAGCRVAEGSGAGAAASTQPVSGPYVSHSFPAGRYISVPWSGKIPEMKDAFADIMQRLVPELGLTMPSQGTCIEDYPDNCWDAETQTMKCELLVQVED